MGLSTSVDDLRFRLATAEQHARASLILNPVENIPFPADLAAAAGPLHGLYNSDKNRQRHQRLETGIQFGGRSTLEQGTRLVYDRFAQALGAADATLRLLSGLNGHIVLFMSMARAGETVLLLPVEAGGHTSGARILSRLGLRVLEMEVDHANRRVDIEATIDRWRNERVDYILIDRSEGIQLEDFSALVAAFDACSIYDGSQYLSNIIAGDHPNPFDQGFDLMVASTHKNFPGPQKALLATAVTDDRWQRILDGVSSFVSNLHVGSIYAAGLTLARTDWLVEYSRRMLTTSRRLEEELAAHGVPVRLKDADAVATHHSWIVEGDPDRAFATYESLERCRLLVNFRLLPYGQGYGLRLGTSAASRLGLETGDVSELAALIATTRADGATPANRLAAANFIERLWQRDQDDARLADSLEVG